MAVAADRDEIDATPGMTRVYADHSYFVKRSLLRLGVTPADADDVMQQVFLVVSRRFDEYLAFDSKRGWLFGVSRLVSRNYHRGRRRARRCHRWLVPLPTFDLDDVLRRREAGRIVSKFLAGLKESERTAFYLADVEGLTAKEIAVELDVNMNTIYTRLRAARRRFSTMLARIS